jgi:NhaP-type Na+/H+ or K+/H+ antiporter
MLEWIAFVLIGSTIPFLVLRNRGGTLRSVIACVLGFVLTFAMAMVGLWYTQEVLRVPALESNAHFFGIGIWAGLIGSAVSEKIACEKGYPIVQWRPLELLNDEGW